MYHDQPRRDHPLHDPRARLAPFGVADQALVEFASWVARPFLHDVQHARRLEFTYPFAYAHKMKTTSYSNLRKNLAAAIDQVSADHEPMVITRDKGKPSAVLMSLEDFASYEETRYLLRSPANAARLLEAVAELDHGGGRVRTLIE